MIEDGEGEVSGGRCVSQRRGGEGRGLVSSPCQCSMDVFRIPRGQLSALRLL